VNSPTDQHIISILLACLHQQPGRVSAAEVRRLTASDWDALLQLAAEQRVRPLLYHRLREKNLVDAAPKTIVDRLEDAYRRNTFRNLRLSAEFRRMALSMQEADIPIIALKGLYLASAVYEQIGLREMNDIDLLAPRQNMAQAANVLSDLGYYPRKAYVLESDLAWSHHLTRYVQEGKASVELHWNITAPQYAYHIDVRELWDRARPVNLAGVDALALSPEDLILHLCLHTSYQHRFEFGLRPSCDLAAAIRHFERELDWEAVRERAVRWGWRRGAALALLLAQDLVGATPPDGLIDALQPEGISPLLLDAAREQIFTSKQTNKRLSGNVARLLEVGRSPPQLLGHLWRMFFPSRSRMSKAYGVPSASYRLYFTYPRRWWEMLRRNAANVLRLLRGEKAVGQLAQRKNTLAQWLELD